MGTTGFRDSFVGRPVVSAGPVRLPSRLALATLAAMLVCSIPFWTGPWIGMVDYPHHLARYFILTRFEAFPDLAAHYRVHWHLLPNIGSDVVVVTLHRATGWPTEWISLVLVGTFAVALIPAVLLLNRALFGRWSWWPLASAVIVFNYVLLFGFVNYMAGVPLAIALAAGWILLRDRPLALVLPGFALGALVLFFFHLYAFAIYGLLILCHELVLLIAARGARVRLMLRQAIAALHVAPPFLILVAFSPVAENASAGRTRLSTIPDKVMGIYSVLSIGIREINLASFAVVGGVVLAGLVSRRLAFSASGLTMVAALGVVFLVMPFTLLGSGFADYRLPIVIAAVAIAGSTWRGLPRRWVAVVALALGGLALVRVGAMTAEWAHANRRYAEIMRVMSGMEPGRRMLALTAQEYVTARFQRRPPIENASGFAVIVRQAFVPNLFAEPEKQPISFVPSLAPLGINPPRQVRLYDPAAPQLSPAALAPYDYLLLHARTPLRREMPGHLQRVDDGSVPDIALFAILRP